MIDDIGNYEGSVIQFFVPDHEVAVFFSYICKFIYPGKIEDDFYIIVYTNYIYDNGKPVDVYRISLDEPKYIYGSDKLPDDIRDIVIKTIMDNYKRGLEAINEYREEIIYDVNRPVPDYTQL